MASVCMIRIGKLMRSIIHLSKRRHQQTEINGLATNTQDGSHWERIQLNQGGRAGGGKISRSPVVFPVQFSAYPAFCFTADTNSGLAYLRSSYGLHGVGMTGAFTEIVNDDVSAYINWIAIGN